MFIWDVEVWQNKLVFCVFSLCPINVLFRNSTPNVSGNSTRLTNKLVLVQSLVTNKVECDNHQVCISGESASYELSKEEGRNSRAKRRKDPSSHVAGANGVSNGVDQSLPALKTRTHLLSHSLSLSLSLSFFFPLASLCTSVFLRFIDETRIITGELSSTEIIIIDRSIVFVFPLFSFFSLVSLSFLLVHDNRDETGENRHACAHTKEFNDEIILTA